ncbi:uncharacterized protein LOC124667051 [Lolium rigidum]|uniref:uncharacterized protein LOC124667051 n=1 Tax=Lolium rigidum TaxID=89674 RepID=UPI001F5E1C00|nr:uncharacterized protein LOC124667051 [Lolium rigidum]
MSTVEDELSEREVLWPEARHGAPASAPGLSSSSMAPELSRSRLPSSAGYCSRPVDIPGAARLPRGRAGADLADDDDEEEDEADDGCGGAMVPPHLMVSRRRSDGEAAVAFSLRSGPGRARRDLSHLRHSVLRMTGFIEG